MRNISGRDKMLTAAVMAALLSMPAQGYAMQTEYVNYNGRRIAEMNFLSQGENLGSVEAGKAGFNLDSSLKEAVKTSTEYWTDMLGPKAKNGQPWQIYVTTESGLQNAAAETTSITVNQEKETVSPVNFVAKQLQDGKQLVRMTQEIANRKKKPDGDYGLSLIYIGQYFGANRKGATEGWWVDPDTVLPSNEQAADFVGAFRHELGHALGISKRLEYIDEEGDIVSSGDIMSYPDTGEPMICFHGELSDADSWNMHLVDQNLNPAKPGMEIVSGTVFAAKKKANPNLKESDFFIVNNEANKEDISGQKGNAFFVGEHVTETLAGAKFFGVSGIPVNTWEGKKFEGSHLQTAGMMSHRDYSNYTSFMEVELAVMQDMGYDIDRKAYFGYSVYGNGGNITNTQGYFARNAEGTAYIVGQPSQVPLGIGLHIYGSRNKVTQAADILTAGRGATGVRVDGMRNTLTVPAATKIQADGFQGNGILIAYGRNQVVNQAGTVTANGKKGTGIRFDFGSSSNGAGDEYRGSYIRYKRNVEERTGTIMSPENLKLTDMGENDYNAGKDELNGPQVKEYNLTGALSGAENAIYISKNAFVKDINIKEGASINGNITSDWKHFKTDGSYDGAETTETVEDIDFSDWMKRNYPEAAEKFEKLDEGDATPEDKAELERYGELYEKATKVKKIEGPLRIQYNGKTGEKGYAYDAYIPDLVTNLNFTAIMAYNGNITGADNMKLHVKGGALQYSGKADVVGVTVDRGAVLSGGSYTVHDMSGKVAEDFKAKLDDTDKGNFINHGTIGALTDASSMTITGNLISDGALLGVAGGSGGTIHVSGSATIGGSDVIAKNLLPEETFKVLKADSVSGDVNNTESNPYKFGMLNEVGAVEGNTAVVTGKAANNLNTDDPVQNETFAAMVAMDRSLKDSGDSRRNEMRPLFTLTPSETKETLTSIASNASAKSMALAQSSTVIGHLLSLRLNDAFRSNMAPSQNAAQAKNGAPAKELEVEVPVQRLDDSDEKGITLSLPVMEPVDNDIWLKFGKNWGDMREGTDYHSSTTLLGWDKAYGNNWRAGVFTGYGKTGFSDNTASNELKDVRFGLYGGYSKGKSEGMVYLDYGWLRNKLRRGIKNLGLTASADYHSRILELGGEYLYDLHAEKDMPWHVRPYMNAQLSRLWQDAYSEGGAGVFGQNVGSKHNNYFGAGAGVEFKRYLTNGSFAIRAGVKHAFAGAEPKLRYGYLGDSANTYEMRNVQDRTHFVLSLGGEAEVAKGWTIGGDAGFVRGSHDKDWSCSVTVRRMW